jgi:hypothetical protein
VLEDIIFTVIAVAGLTAKRRQEYKTINVLDYCKSFKAFLVPFVSRTWNPPNQPTSFLVQTRPLGFSICKTNNYYYY